MSNFHIWEPGRIKFLEFLLEKSFKTISRLSKQLLISFVDGLIVATLMSVSQSEFIRLFIEHQLQTRILICPILCFTTKYLQN